LAVDLLLLNKALVNEISLWHEISTFLEIEKKLQASSYERAIWRDLQLAQIEIKNIEKRGVSCQT